MYVWDIQKNPEVTYQLGVELSQTRLTLAVEDQDRVDHDEIFFPSDIGGLCRVGWVVTVLS